MRTKAGIFSLVAAACFVTACAASGDDRTTKPDLVSGATTDLASTDLVASSVDLAVPDLVLTLLPNGAACTISAGCFSGYCIDGVCCSSGCNGTCESCVVADHIGVCTPVPEGQNPDNECPGNATLNVDGGLGDGGDFSQIDGGSFVDYAACAGRCNGNRGCGFPTETTTCGAPYCSEANQSARFLCDGQGGCSVAKTTCPGTYCASGNCGTQCNKHADCTTGFYCNGVTSECAPLKTDGLLCTVGSECEHGFCADGVCCNAACDEPGSCTDAGHEGVCMCGASACAAGVACVLFYRDLDKDGFGDKFGTLANGAARTGCANLAPPTGFVTNADDCDDGDMRANPNAEGYFEGASLGRGIWDYDCDGVVEKESREHVSGSCKFCAGNPDACTTSTTCQTAGQQAVMTCEAGTTFCSCGTFLCLCQRCGAGLFSSPSVGFVGTVACGSTGTYRTCGSCSAVNGAPGSATDDFTKKQKCR